jgi:predicted methyltransferase
VLKPGGVFAVTEHVMDPHYTRPGTVRRLCEASGLRHLNTVGAFFEQTSRYVK